MPHNLAKIKSYFSKLPFALTLLFFINSCTLSFPAAAFTNWLSNDLDLKSRPELVTLFFTIKFVPYSLKPLYAVISDHLPICGQRRKSYIILCGILSACGYTATLFIESFWCALIIGVSTSATDAFSELLLDLFLVDFVAASKRREEEDRQGENYILLQGEDSNKASSNVSATEAQSLALAVKSIATVFCCVVILPIYCSSWQPSPRIIIALTGILPISSSAVAVWLNEDEGERQAIESSSNSSSEKFDGKRLSGAGVGLLTLAVQLLLLWSNMYSFTSKSLNEHLRLNRQAWLYTLILFIAISFVLVYYGIKVLRWKSRSSGADSGYREVESNLSEAGPDGRNVERGKREKKLGLGWIILLPLLLFTMNATPSANDTLETFYASAIWPPHSPTYMCSMQRLSIVTNIGAVLGCLIFARFRRRNQSENVFWNKLIAVMIATNCIASLARLLLVPVVGKGDGSRKINIIGAPVDIEAYLIVINALTSILNQAALVPMVAFITECAGFWGTKAGTFYAIYTGAMEFGVSVSGWITAAIVRAERISSGRW
eukprot:g5207.t1